MKPDTCEKIRKPNKNILRKGNTVQYIHKKVKNKSEGENRTKMIDYTMYSQCTYKV